MRTFLFLAGFLLLAHQSFSQTRMEDVVYLKNGSVVRGQILELVPDSIVKVELLGGSLFVFRWEEIKTIKKEPSKNPDPYYGPARRPRQPRRSGEIKIKGNGYSNITELGMGFGQGSSSWVVMMLRNINSYRLMPAFSAGVGIGLDRYLYDGTLMPVFVDLRGDFIREKPVTPYYFVQGGYGFSWLNDTDLFIEYRGGAMVHGGLGVKFYSRQKAAFLFSIGYLSQSSRRTFEEFDPWTGQPLGNTVTILNSYRRISWNVGVQF